MASTGVGERLRNARTARGLTLDDIETATRIKQRYLDALEREAWEELPGRTYVRGFLASYARQLGISVDEILSLFPSPQAPAGAAPRPVEVRITPANPQSRLRRIVTAIAVLVVAGTVALTYVLVGQLRQFAATRPRPGATEPAQSGTSGSRTGEPPSAASAVTPTSGAQSSAPAAGGQTVTPTSGGPATGAASPGIPAGQRIVINAQATDRSWVRVVADGSVVFEGFVSAGDHQVWQAQHQLNIRVGNASALDLSVNGQPVGRLGNPGDVVERTFSSGPLTPATAPSTPPAAAPGGPPASPRPAAPGVTPAPAAPPAPPAAPSRPQFVTPTGPEPTQHQ